MDNYGLKRKTEQATFVELSTAIMVCPVI